MEKRKTWQITKQTSWIEFPLAKGWLVFWKVKYFEIEKLLPFPEDIFSPSLKIVDPFPRFFRLRLWFPCTEQLVMCLQRNLFVNSRLSSSRFFVGNFCSAQAKKLQGASSHSARCSSWTGKASDTLVSLHSYRASSFHQFDSSSCIASNNTSKLSIEELFPRVSIPPEKFDHYLQINWRTYVHMWGIHEKTFRHNKNKQCESRFPMFVEIFLKLLENFSKSSEAFHFAIVWRISSIKLLHNVTSGYSEISYDSYDDPPGSLTERNRNENAK